MQTHDEQQRDDSPVEPLVWSLTSGRLVRGDAGDSSRRRRRGRRPRRDRSETTSADRRSSPHDETVPEDETPAATYMSGWRGGRPW